MRPVLAEGENMVQVAAAEDKVVGPPTLSVAGKQKCEFIKENKKVKKKVKATKNIRKKGRKHARDQESKIQEKTIPNG